MSISRRSIHEIDPANNAGGRFTVVPNGVDFNGFPRYSMVVEQGGPQLLNYEAPVHTPANQSHQFVDNQYQIVVNTYSDTPANGGVLVAVRQFTVILNDVGARSSTSRRHWILTRDARSRPRHWSVRRQLQYIGPEQLYRHDDLGSNALG